MLHEQFFDSDKDELVTTWNLSLNICSKKAADLLMLKCIIL